MHADMGNRNRHVASLVALHLASLPTGLAEVGLSGGRDACQDYLSIECRAASSHGYVLDAHLHLQEKDRGRSRAHKTTASMCIHTTST